MAIGAEITRTFENGRSMCGASIKSCFDPGTIDIREINLPVNFMYQKYYRDGTKRNAYANTTPMLASHPAYIYLVAKSASSYCPVSLGESTPFPFKSGNYLSFVTYLVPAHSARLPQNTIWPMAPKPARICRDFASGARKISCNAGAGDSVGIAFGLDTRLTCLNSNRLDKRSFALAVIRGYVPRNMNILSKKE